MSRKWLVPVIVAMAGLVYLPTLKYDFVWDDQMLITENRNLETSNPLNLFSQAFWPATSGEGYYRPLVMASFWGERQLWGLNPLPFHLTNLLLNCLAGLLAAILLSRLFRQEGWNWPALLGGLVFVLHPAHVESVAFICGRTDLLMAVFLLASLLLLMSFRERPGVGRGIGIIACFAAALLCKETAVVFPLFVLLVLLPAMRRRATWYLLGIMAVLVLVYLAVRSVVVAGAQTAWAEETAGQRVMLVVNGFGRYFLLSIVPFFHRLIYADAARFSAFGWPTLLGVPALAGLGFLAVRHRAQPLGLGSAWFLLFVLPVSNIFPIGVTYLAERLLYLPVLGLIIVCLALLVPLSRRRGVARLLCIAGIAYAFALGADTLQRMPIWQDNARLYATMVREAPDSPQAHYNLGTVLDKAGDDSGAIAEYSKAIELSPRLAQAHNNLGLVRARGGDIPGAIADFSMALAIDSAYANAWYNLAGALARAGDKPGAIRACRQALEFDPGLTAARRSLARALLESGDAAGAVEEYRRVAALVPGDAGSHHLLAEALQAAGDLAAAIEEYRRALSLQPDMAEARNGLAIALQEAGDMAGALAEFRRSAELRPEDPLAHANLGAMLEKLGDLRGAEAAYRRALELAPDFAQVRQSLEELVRRRELTR